MEQAKTKKDDRSALVRPLVVLDAGNRTINYLDASGKSRMMPAYIKQLQPWDDTAESENSVNVEVNGQRYVVGELARQLNGKAIHELSKSQSYWIIVASVLEPVSENGVIGVDKLRILCPDKTEEFKQAAKYIESLEWLPSDRRYLREGREVSLTWIRSVELIEECLPAWKYAKRSGWWSYPDRKNGVIDLGGAETTARLIAPNGVILRGDADLSLPGTVYLATMISGAIKRNFRFNPDPSSIMDAIGRGEYALKVMGTTGEQTVDFSKEFAICLDQYVSDLKSKIKTAWQEHWGDLGEVLIVGGSAPLLHQVEVDTQGRFRVARHEAIENFSQSINIYGMAEV